MDRIACLVDSYLQECALYILCRRHTTLPIYRNRRYLTPDLRLYIEILMYTGAKRSNCGCGKLSTLQYLPMAMLATHWKNRLPYGWSYPIGAQELSQNFGDIPGARKKPLWFTHAGFSRSQHDVLKQEDQLYCVLKLSLERDGIFMEDADAVCWDVHVCAIPSGLRAAVRRSFLPRAMGKVRAWLTANRPDTKLDGGAYCSILVRESDALLFFENCARKFDDPVREEIPQPPHANSI
jgi:hypothetical protein